MFDVRQSKLSMIRVCAALGVASGVASAQVAPPPPAQAPVEPEYNPKPMPQRPAPAQQTATRSNQLPLNTPYPKLAVPGEDGRIIRLKQLPDILALRSNPTVGEPLVDRIMPVLYGRRARFEVMVIENLDLYWKLTGGELANLDMTDLAQLTRVTEMIKPLVGKTTLSEELGNRKIMTRVQSGMNEHIVQEYKKAIGDEIQAIYGQDGISEFMRFVLEDSIQEDVLAYQGMLVEAKSMAVELLGRAGIQNERVAALNGMISTDPNAAERDMAEFDAAVRTMSVDEAMRFFTTLRESREHINIAPTIDRIEVMRPDKIMYKGDLNATIIKPGDPLPDGMKMPNANNARKAGTAPGTKPDSQD